MLTWTQRSDGWYANGLRIELAAPFRWLLLDAEEKELASVRLETKPLAVARSLTECKREAELLMAKRRRRNVQRHQIATLLLVLACAPLLVGTDFGFNAIIVIAAVTIATRSLVVLLGSLLPRALGEQHEVFYQ